MVASKGMGNIFVKKKDGQEAIKCDVIYASSIVINLISLGKLLDKNYKMRLEDKELKVFYVSSKLDLKEPLSTKITFKIMTNMVDHQCIASTIIGDQN